ncbi:MAG: hypothetical protein AVDCRST_MAG89-733, partial [uncultured Gemmatimonadetes bacterium]
VGTHRSAPRRACRASAPAARQPIGFHRAAAAGGGAAAHRRGAPAARGAAAPPRARGGDRRRPGDPAPLLLAVGPVSQRIL